MTYLATTASTPTHTSTVHPDFIPTMEFLPDVDILAFLPKTGKAVLAGEGWEVIAYGKSCGIQYATFHKADDQVAWRAVIGGQMLKGVTHWLPLAWDKQ